jgi:organic hydroperoxide reductase OsmC/OhrA
MSAPHDAKSASRGPRRVATSSGRQHHYPIRMKWTGNTGTGTREYRGYERAHEYSVPGKPVIPGSSDPAFRGDKTRYNPEELLVMSLSSCHMLWFLHLAAEAGVVVTAYEDEASGTMVEAADTRGPQRADCARWGGSGGHFTEVVLRPRVTFAAASDQSHAAALHEHAHHLCFIANSVNFPVRCEPV